MNNTLIIAEKYFAWLPRFFKLVTPERWVIVIAVTLAVLSTAYSFTHGYIIAYGDAESHLNIAKRVIDSLTPGFAQLGGIWLPLPHLFLVPLVYFDWLWKTGLAGSVVSGIAFVVSAVFLYRLTFVLTKDGRAAFIAAIAFVLNPNILYLQSTPMTEMTLIVFFILSSYFFIRFLLDDTDLLMLILAAFFGFCASLSRYDGWGLVLVEAGVLVLYYLPYRIRDGWSQVLHGMRGFFAARSDKPFGERFGLLEGRLILFSTLAFFGILLWFLWDWLILGDPLYFTHSQFSAASQQQGWLARGELPAYHNIGVALLYYFVTSLESMGILLALAALAGVYVFLGDKTKKYQILILLVLFVPFLFNVATLFLGQSVIFLPGLTPPTFEWTLFNVRYGTMMVPFFAIFTAYLFYRSRTLGRTLVTGVVALQAILFVVGFSPVLAFKDGMSGLSSAIAKMPDAQAWIAREYDYGMVLTDDFARTISIVRTPMKMKDVIYIGNKPYWAESLVEPEKYARWIIMQKNDVIWRNLIDKPELNARLFKYFNKVYTSEDILIFRRIDVYPAN
ncbi:MAG: Glycosyl transferase family 2 [Parcubacteria group bacterium GW2011_GWA1_47_8]|nr:MAG: Glycosyl transferase family 2 [Parcubacteria group bacterium GW2011_GWA1_47_8]